MKNRQGLQAIERTRSASAQADINPTVSMPTSCRMRDEPLHHMRESAAAAELPLALKASEQRLSDLLADRERLGRDLHDCVLQSLYVIGLSIETSRRQFPQALHHVERFTDQVTEQLNRLIHDIRRIISELQSDTVQPFDLAHEIRSIVQTYKEVGQLDIRLRLDPAAMEPLTYEEEQEIAQIVREALSNCVRHAHATRAHVSLQATESRSRLTIHDNGAGFHVAAGRTGGFGLANMAARAKKLGGQLQVRSQVGRGTEIVVEFSLEPNLSPV